MGVGTFVESAVMTTLNTYVTTNSAAISNALVPIATAGVATYILWTGFHVMRGEGKDPFLTILWRWFRVAVVTGLALNAPSYQSIVVNGMIGIQETFANALGNAATVGATIDTMAAPMLTLSTMLFSEGTTGVLPNFGLIVAGLLTAVATCIIGLTALGMFLVASVSLNLLLALGPAFIFCAMFSSTQKYTESWLGQVFSSIFTNVLLMASIGLFTNIIQTAAGSIVSSYGVSSIIVDVIGLTMLTTTLTYVLMHVQSIATGLSGGLSVGSAGQELGAAVTRALTGGIGAGLRTVGQRVGNRTTPSPTPNSIRPARSSPVEYGVDLYQRYVLDRLRRVPS